MENSVVLILAIDDNQDNLISLKALIKDVFPEAAVLTALTGKQGLQLAAAEVPDVILLDILMPGMDGFEVCARLKADKKLCDIPVVFVTALQGDKENRIKAIKAGAEAFLSKPIDEGELTAQIRAMLKIRDANIQKRGEKALLAKLVEEKTRELKESEQKYINYIENAPDGVFVTDETGHYLEINKAASIITGYEKNELLDMRISDILAPESFEDGMNHFKMLLETGKSTGATQFKHKDGSNRWWNVDAVKLNNQRFLGFAKDITERREAESASKENADRFYSLFNTVSSGVAIYKVKNDGSEGKDYIVVSFNQSALRMENKELAEVQGKSLFDLRPNIDSYGLIPVFQKVWNTGEPAFFPSKAYVDDQYYNWYENRILKLPTGELVAIYDDVTEKMLIQEKLEESERKYSSYIENAPNGVFIIDRNGRYIDVNQTATLMTGYSRKELLEMRFGDFTSDASKDYEKEMFGKLFESGSVAMEIEYVHKNGSKRWRSIDAVRLSEDRYMSFSSDITERKQIEYALSKSEEKFRVAQEMSPDGFTILHPLRDDTGESIDFTFVYENQAIARINQTDPQKIIGRKLLEIFPKSSGTPLFEAYKNVANTGKTQLLEEVYVEEIISEPIWLRLVVVSMGEDIAILAQNITARKENEAKLIHLSYHDHLTGLYSRRFFEDELKRLDTKQNLPLSIIMCDVNGLKLVNDSFGHESGDALLQSAAEAMKKICREKDVLARIGGDEFVILLPKTTADEAVRLANDIKDIALEGAGAGIELSISYGYDTKTTEAQSMLEVIANAENHMYRHKLYERSSLRSKTIDIVMNTLFEKSSREAAHSTRVSHLCQSMAAKMNLDKNAVNQMRIAGLIHDIGKIGINENVLNKPGYLTPEERREIERHPQTGWRILSSTDEFAELAEFILSHHEKWDGSGYPNGLKGEEIPLESRIISIADAYDAMTSVRTYKPSLGKDAAIEELKRCSGTQFDPGIVNVLVDQVLSCNDNFEEPDKIL